VLKSIEGSLSNPQTSDGSYYLVLTAVQFGDRLSTAGENAAAFISGHCSPGSPKVKWFALERSPNVSHLILSHGSPKSWQDISATCFNRRDRHGI
jgi:hypothetical protein